MHFFKNDMNIVEIFGVLVLLIFISRTFFRESSHQLLIKVGGFSKLPKLLLLLAKINKKDSVALGELSKEEYNKILKFSEKLESVASARLTFLYSQSLINVQSKESNWFFAIDAKGGRELITETIGKLDDGTNVEYVLYRRKGNWFKTPVLIGYLHKVNEIPMPLKNEEKEIEVLFEFPENLVKNPFYEETLMNIYKIKKDVIADYHKNELGDDEDLYCVNYEQRERDGIDFRIYP